MVTETERIRLSKGEKTICNYAFKLGDRTVRELKKKLSDLKFDRLQVTDTYLKGMIASSSDLKTEDSPRRFRNRRRSVHRHEICAYKTP